MSRVKNLFVILACILAGLTILSVFIGFADVTRNSVYAKDLRDLNSAPIIAETQPQTAPNDLDTLIMISGTDFTAGMSGTQVITPPLVYLDAFELANVIWVNTSTLSATVPWGLEPGIYTLTVQNSDGETGSLPNAFTVTQGIGVWNTGELYGGAIDKIAINPITPTTLYASYHKIGLFRSYDGGDNWTFQFSGLGIDNPIVDPNAPETIYLAQWATVYRSVDEGETWNQITTTFPSTSTFDYDCWGEFGILPHPTISGTIFIHACDNGEEKSGLIKSTNGGQDWEPAINGLTDTQVTALAFHPVDPDIMYLGTAGGHIFHSEDGGGSWIYDSSPLEYVAALAVDPFGMHNVWISSRNTFGAPCALLKSVGADLTTWIAMEPDPERQCFNKIEFSPTISGTVYVNFGQPFKTIDGGDTWNPFIWVPFENDSPSVNDIALHPTVSNTIYFAESKLGIQKTIDGGTNWEVVNRGLTALIPLQLQVNHNQPDTVYARMEWVGLYKGTRGGQTWQQLPLSNTDFILVDPITPTKVYATQSIDCTPYVYISADSGQTWEPSAPMVRPPQYADHCTFGQALVAVPDQPGVLLVGVLHHHPVIDNQHGSIYRSADYGENWDRIFPTGEQEIRPVTVLAYDALTSTIIYAGTEGSGMLRSTDAGQTWQPMAENIPALDFVRTIAVEPIPPYRVYVLSWIGGNRDMFVSEDHGLSWSPVTPPPDAPSTFQILSTKTQPSALYAASGQGLFRSTDGAQTWQPVEGALGQIPVYSVATVTTDDDRVILYAGTSGGTIENLVNTASRFSSTSGTLINAGVYRRTMVHHQIYLPLTDR